MKKKLVYVLLFSFIVFNICFTVIVNADTTVTGIFGGDGFGGATGAGGIDSAVDETKDASIKMIANFIVVYRIIGIGLAIILLMWIAAKLIWGSLEQKVEAKKYLIVYVIGMFVLLAGSFLLSILQEFLIGNW